MNIKEKVFNAADTAKTHWKTPPLGRYMSYREIFAYSVGGIGVYFIFTMATNIMLSTTNVIIGNTIGISPMHMYAMYIFAVIFNIPLTGLRAVIIDGVRSKKGKYHPYLLATGIPTALLSCGFVFVPYEKIDSYAFKIVLIMVFNIALQFFYNFFYEAYENLIFVLSPNTIERSDVITIKSVTYSIAPSVMNPLIPFIANFVSDGDIYDLRVYRSIYLPVAFFGIALTTLVFAWTKEKIVQAKTHVIQVRFFDALKAVAKNKYFWIISLAGWIGFLENSCGVIHSWLYQYDKTQNISASMYSLIVLVLGNASLWGMLATPVLIRKFGKRNVMIISNVLNIVFIGMMYPFVHSLWLVVMCIWFNFVVGAFAVVLNPAINADIRDYQHYISGERIDGMFASVGLIGSVITLATSGVLPVVYEKYGIFKGNGYENMYDVLYDPDILFTLVRVLVLLGVLGATLNVIPYFFYDLTEEKQQGMINVLKLRAFFEDYSKGVLTDENLVEVVDIINKSKVDAVKEYLPVKGVKGKTKKQNKKINNDIYVARFVTEELDKFNNPLVKSTVENAKRICEKGLNGMYDFIPDILDDAKSLPKNTVQEKKFRKDRIEFAKICLSSKKCADKYYPDGIKEFDMTRFDSLFEKEDEIEKQINKIVSEMQKGDKNAKTEIKALKLKKKNTEKEEKRLSKESSLYLRATKAYSVSQKLIIQYENYIKYDEIAKLYDGALIRKQENEEKNRIKAENEKKAQKEYSQKLKNKV